MLRLGIYKHYKGKEKRVISVAKHSETLEEFVVYESLYDDHQVWIRPLGMFKENVVVDGKEVPRFEWLREY